MQSPVARSQGHWIFAAISLASVLGLVVLRLFTTPDSLGHSTHEQLGLPACWMMKVAGVPCPGCGVTTAASYLARGEIERAVVTQPFGVLLVVGSLLVFAWIVVETVRGKDAWVDFRRLCRPWMFWGLGGVMLAAWVYKIAMTR